MENVNQNKPEEVTVVQKPQKEEKQTLDKNLYYALFKGDLEKEKAFRIEKEAVTKDKTIRKTINDVNLKAENLFKEADDLIVSIILNEEEKTLIQEKKATLSDVEFDAFYKLQLKNKRRDINTRKTKENASLFEFYLLWETTKSKRREEADELYNKLKTNSIPFPETKDEVVPTISNPETVVATVTSNNSYEEKLAFAYSLFKKGQYSAALNSLEEVVCEYASNGHIILLYLFARLGIPNSQEIESVKNDILYYDIYLRAVRMLPPSSYREHAQLLCCILEKAVEAKKQSDILIVYDMLSRSGVVDVESKIDNTVKDLCLKYALSDDDKFLNRIIPTITVLQTDILLKRIEYQVRISLIEKDFSKAKSILKFAQNLSINSTLLELQQLLLKKRSSTFREYPIKKKMFSSLCEKYRNEQNPYLLEVIAQGLPNVYKPKKAMKKVQKLYNEQLIQAPEEVANFLSEVGLKAVKLKKKKLAKKCFQKALDENNRCYLAYIGLLLIDLKVKSIEEVALSKTNYLESENYALAKAYGKDQADFLWIENQIAGSSVMIKNIDKKYHIAYFGKWVGVALFIVSVILGFVDYYASSFTFALACGVPKFFKTPATKNIIIGIVIIIIIAAILIVPYFLFFDLLLEYIENLSGQLGI